MIVLMSMWMSLIDKYGKHNDDVGVGFGESVPFKSFGTNGNKDDLCLMYDKCKELKECRC